MAAGWGTWLAVVAGPVVKKVLASLGVGVLTMVGLGAIKASIDSAVASAWSGVAGSTYQIISMAGFVDAVSYWLAAVTTVVAYLALGRLGVLAGVGLGQ